MLAASGRVPAVKPVDPDYLNALAALLKAGADPDRADNSGRTARDYAKLTGNPALLNVIESDAKPKGKAGQGPQIFGPKF